MDKLCEMPVLFQKVTVVVNVVWFGLAFLFFSVRPRHAARLLTPCSSEGAAVREALIASLRFLGGMNLGMAALSAVQLAAWSTSVGPSGPVPLFVGAAVAHASQFAFNVPFALQRGRRGGAPWDVLSGPMAFIFVVDAICALLNVLVMVL
jgi:hypothetical protein